MLRRRTPDIPDIDRYTFPQQLPFGRTGLPASCVGMVCCAGNCGGENPTRFPAHSVIVPPSDVLGVGSEGTDVSTLLKLNAVVMSPTAPLRHADRFGTSAPNRVSMNRSNDV